MMMNARKSGSVRQAARSRILPLVILMLIAPAAQAIPVTYAITTNALQLNNPNGTWGGNLNLGAAQNINLTVAYTFEGNAGSISGNEAIFDLIGLQVFDNTHGLASDFIAGTGSIGVRYNGAMDLFSSGTFGSPGGSFSSMVTGEFGDVGDALPTGAGFDAIMEGFGFSFPFTSDLLTLVARAPDFANDNISGVNGARLTSGSFSFLSTAVPEPITGALGLMGLGVLGMATRRRSA